MDGEGIRRTADHWSHVVRQGDAAPCVHWTGLKAVRDRLNTKISGSPTRDWADHLLATHLRDAAPVQRAVSLCCGAGRHDRRLLQAGLARECIGLDVAPSMLDEAHLRAEEAGLNGLQYEECDVNTLQLPPQSADLALSFAALHHVRELERVLDQVAAALRPSGLFIVRDYVGPDRLQLTPAAREAANAALALLPERYRRSVSFDLTGDVGMGREHNVSSRIQQVVTKLRAGTLWSSVRRRLRISASRRSGGSIVKTRVVENAPEEVALVDPSEAVRSSEILSLLRERFEIIELTPLGGTLLSPVLDDIAGNFAPDDPSGAELLQMLFAIEDALLAAGEVESNEVFLVAHPR